MKILKNYELFVEGRKHNNLFDTKTNEGLKDIFGKIATTAKSLYKNFTEFMNTAWSKIQAEFGDHAWWYGAMALNTENVEKKLSDAEKAKMKYGFYGYSVTPAERKKALDEISNLTTTENYPLAEEEPLESQPIQVQDVQKMGTPNVQAPTTQVQTQPEFEKEAIEESYRILTESLLANIEDLTLNEAAVELASDFEENANAQEVRKLIRRCFNMKTKGSAKFADEQEYKKRGGTDQESVFIWGAPGIGKTDILKQLCIELDVDLIVWTLATATAGDFIGNPGVEQVPNEETGKLEPRSTFFLPKIYPTSNGPKGKGMIMFFDEMNRAPISVLAAALQLCLAGKIGDYVLPSKCLVVAAGNRKEDVPTVTQIEKALSNRFAHVNLTTTPNDWKEWGLTIGKDELLPEIIGFVVDYDKRFFHMMDPKTRNMAWPSPRSWTKGSKSLIALREEMTGSKDGEIPAEETRKCLSYFVGAEAADAFVRYQQLLKFFTVKDIENVYDNPTKAPKLPTKSSDYPIARAVLLSIAGFKRGVILTDKQIENVFKWAMSEDRRELCALFLGYIKKVHFDSPENITSKKAWQKELVAFNEYYFADPNTKGNLDDLNNNETSDLTPEK